ncbi:hypothetical protein GD416_11340 [Burkholderia sp. BE24]|uniref:hypothetical protein n=1 Tax=unclassified Burkholderia TaxID=2613784 RepID=UPI00117C164F|nr:MULTISPECIES: hypothetical protein [unclassified Burkholderia]MPV57013.1 hypothetical protein [Burkholderia sp. BE24]
MNGAVAMDSTSQNFASGEPVQSADALAVLQARVEVLETELVQARAQVREATMRARRNSYQASAAQAQAEAAERQLSVVLSSSSWRITAPVRAVAHVAKSAIRFARDPSWPVLKRRSMSLLRETARRSSLARAMVFWVRDRHPRLWARLAPLAAPRFAAAQSISVTRWKEGSVSRRNYAELVAARAPQCDRAAIESFLDSDMRGVDSRKLAGRLAEICAATVAGRDGGPTAL